MVTLIQIILVNIAVSCDNVGVIAIATRGLPEQKAVYARRIGIFLSLILKLLFIGIIGFLFSIPWLHIRIIGGVLLLYVTHNMLRQNTYQEINNSQSETNKNDNFILVILSIIAADVCMSLDNVIAILSIVSTDGRTLDLKGLLLIIAGLIICVPILLWFSGTISKLMERFGVLTYLCGGYLVYTSIKMIFEDETICLFCEQINFPLATTVAVFCGVLLVLFNLFVKNNPLAPTNKVRKRMVTYYCIIALYWLMTLVKICYLSANPFGDEPWISLHITQLCGATAVQFISASDSLLTLCGAIFIGNRRPPKGDRYLQTLKAPFFFFIGAIAIGLSIYTIGLTKVFGFGTIYILSYFCFLLLQTILLCGYAAVFRMISAFTNSRRIRVTLSILYIFLETLLSDILAQHKTSIFFAGFFPNYYVEHLSASNLDISLILRALLIGGIYVLTSIWIGKERWEKNNTISFT